jgi:hypothetical protein
MEGTEDEKCAPTFVACTFRGNTAQSGGAVTVHQNSEPVFQHCTFVGNQSNANGGAFVIGGFPADLTRLANCTLYGNECADYFGYASGLLCQATGSVIIENTIVASGIHGQAVACGDYPIVDLLCCDLHGNDGGDWEGCIAYQEGINGNISEDPLFCDPAQQDFHLQEDSPCGPFTPPNAECDLIGSRYVGCEGGPQAMLPGGTAVWSVAFEPCDPNPFWETTNINFSIPSERRASRLHLAVYDIAGRQIRALLDGGSGPGSYGVRWDGRDDMGRRIAGGTYFVRLRFGETSASTRVVVLR